MSEKSRQVDGEKVQSTKTTTFTHQCPAPPRRHREPGKPRRVVSLLMALDSAVSLGLPVTTLSYLIHHPTYIPTRPVTTPVPI
ncbi:hypothetical protein P691DRAFT_812651 [Macrolepiota fuliginosa MF-IS2]|uniref:Uncharacterized protein n=1 Tax=Macrolepiota fuliginosa MF-IS2 TaxID=1400762 RepID=A0A9P5WZ27_9AGAR|nr:hypothetical protein P691DRAFT_812651 [Macrolepiota fuliginosa MF-IS2]